MSMRPDRLLRIALSVAAGSAGVTLLYATHLRAGHVWGGDFALYVMHAQNIANGTAYAATPFIPNPAAPAHSPVAFPPGYPAMLAPAWRLGSLDYRVLKLATVAWFPLLCVSYTLLAAMFLTPAATMGFAVTVMLHPIFYVWRDFVGPEIPFSVMVGLFLCAESWCRRSGLRDRRPMAVGLLLGTLAFLAFTTITIGVACVLALMAHDLTSRRRLTLVTTTAVIAFGAFAVLSEVGLGLDQFAELTRLVGIRPPWLVAHADQLARMALQIWTTGLPRLLAAGALLVLVGLSGRGIVLPREAVPAVAIWYLVLTLAFGLFSGFGQIPNPVDLMMPLVPVVLLLAWRGASSIKLGRSFPAGSVLLGLVLLVCYTAGFRAAPTGPIANGIFQSSFTELTHAIRATTPETARIAVWNPRVLALYTGRQSFVPSSSRDPAAVWENIRAMRASHLVITRFAPDEAGILSSLVQQHAPDVSLRYSNADYALYQLEPVGMAGPRPSSSATTPGGGASSTSRPPDR
jgi:hypothetical protein